MKNKYLLQFDIQAANGDEPQVTKVKGVAYTGCDILQWRGAMVIDLAGMQFAQQIPLMNSHFNDPSCKLGEVVARVEDNQLLVEGVITSQSEEAKQIIADGKLSKWQLSIGARILAQKFVDEGEKVTVNGIEFKGPIYVVSKSLLREVSVVAIGADKGASMEITASLDMSELQVTSPTNEGETKMNGNKENAVNAATKTGKVEPVGRIDASQPVAGNDVNAKMLQETVEKASADAIKAERQRVADIQEICAGECSDIEAQAIKEGWDVNKTRNEVLKHIRANRPKTGPNINTGVQAVGKDEIECALCMRLGISGDVLLKAYKENTVEAAENICDISLKEVIHEAIKLSGASVHSRVGMNDDDIRAAFSTVTLPGILSTVANKVMMKSYEAVNPAAYRLCSTGSLTDFKPSNRYRLTDMGNLEPIAPDGEIKEGGLTEEHAVNQLDTYGKKFCLTRKMIIDDDLDAFAKIPAMMGQRAAKLVDKLFFERLISNPTQEDGSALFSTAHRNIISTDGAFGKESLQKAIEMFENQVDADGQPIATSASRLLVPSALKFAAKELLHSALMIATGSSNAKMPAYNVMSDENLEIVSSPYLKNALDWYLFGNPSEIDTFEIGFLKGKRTPTIQQGDTDFNTLGMWFRIYFDIGVREQDYRGVLKVIGA
jgi:hypothetical protein